MGAVDLVIQVESPKSVARGLQRDRPRRPRAGRRLAGPHLPEVPRRPARVGGRRAAHARRRDRGDEDPAQPARRARAADRRDLRRRGDRGRRAARRSCAAPTRSPTSRASSSRTCSTCSPAAIRRTSSPSCGRAIVWDRTADVVKGRQGARRLAVTNAGTIPDRGLFGVHLVDGGGRVGELDEEMVYEARAGQTFLLGASTWRIEEITRDRVLVSPAPGRARARCRSGRARASAGPYELGEAIGAASRELVALREREGARAPARRVHARRARRRRTCSRSCGEQAGRDRCRSVGPDDRRRALPRRDRRLARLHPHAVRRPRARAVGARARRPPARVARARGAVDLVGRRDRHPPARRRRAAAGRGAAARSRARSRISSSQELGETALFGARFRENAARALLIPRRRPGERTPLWQQRLKAQSLLQVARRYPAFPVVLETYRECLQDVFDLPALKRLLQGLRTRQIDLVDVETAVRLAVRGLAALRLRRDVHVRGRHAAGRAAGAGALARPRPAARAARPGGAARPARLRRGRGGRAAAARARRGPPTSCTTCCAGAETCGQTSTTTALAEPLVAERRAVRVRVAGEERLIAAEDAGRYRDALGAMPPCGLPEVFLEAERGAAAHAGAPLRALARAVHDRGGERALRPRRRARAAASSSGEDELVRGELRPGGTRARVVRPGGAAPAAARVARRAAPRGRAGRAGRVRALPAQLARDRPARVAARGARRRCRGCALPVALWESEVLPRRVPGYRPEQLDQLCASGEVVWVGAGLDRVAVYFREDAAGARPPAGAADRPEGEVHDAIRAALGRSALVLARPARRHGPRGGGGAARALGSRLGRRGDERRLDSRCARAGATACRRRKRRPRRFSRRRAGDGDRDAGTLVAHGAPVPRRARTGARSPSCCSSARASSRATASAARASPAATAPSTAS